MQYSIINHNNQAVPYILVTYLFYKEIVVYIYNRILLSNKKERNLAICDNVD